MREQRTLGMPRQMTSCPPEVHKHLDEATQLPGSHTMGACGRRSTVQRHTSRWVRRRGTGAVRSLWGNQSNTSSYRNAPDERRIPTGKMRPLMLYGSWRYRSESTKAHLKHEVGLVEE